MYTLVSFMKKLPAPRDGLVAHCTLEAKWLRRNLPNCY